MLPNEHFLVFMASFAKGGLYKLALFSYLFFKFFLLHLCSLRVVFSTDTLKTFLFLCDLLLITLHQLFSTASLPFLSPMLSVAW